MNATQIIEALGGSATLARRLGFDKERGTQRVNNWKARGIPLEIRVKHPRLFRGYKVK